MSVELLYTSAAQGLKQGSRGFCTVLSTAGMPINLATRLEGLSAYRHQFPPNHPDANQNPVCFSHLRFGIGGRQVSILSRISDYGIDYSQRTNKLAHHVVLDAQELTPAGPAWLMEHGKIFRDAWSGQCETPATGPAIAMQNQSPRVCMEWGHRCGDAGWGGVVADAFMQSGSKPLWIVYGLSQSQQLLRLLNESIALLPVDQRWRATFSTYATNLPPDADCKVRCVLQGTDEARLAPARGAVIDLTKPLPAPPATANVTAAREGPDPSTLTAASSPPIQVTNKELPAASQSRPQVKTQPLPVDSEFKVADDPLQLAPLTSLPPAIKPKEFKKKSAASADDGSSNTRWLKWALVAASVAAVLMLFTTIALLVRPTPVSPEFASGNASIADSNDQSTNSSSKANKSTNPNISGDQNQHGAAAGAQEQSGAVTSNDGTGNDQTNASTHTPGQTNSIKHDNADQTIAQSPNTGSPSGVDSAVHVPESASTREQVVDASGASSSNLNELEKAVDAAKSGQTDENAPKATDGLKTQSPVDSSTANVQKVQPLTGRLMADAVFNSGRIVVELVVPLEESLVGGKYHLTADSGPRKGKAGPIDIVGSINTKLNRAEIGEDAKLTVYLWLTEQGISKAAKSVEANTATFFDVVKKWNNLVLRSGDHWIIAYTIKHKSNTFSEYLSGLENLRKRLHELELELESKKTTALKGVSDASKATVLRQKLIPDLEEVLQELEVAEQNLTNSLSGLDSTTVFSTDPILYVGPTINGEVKTKPIEARFTIEPIFPESKPDETKMPPEKPTLEKADAK